MSDFDVIATVSDHLLDPSTLAEFMANGATILRVNGAHVAPAEIPRYARAIRTSTGGRAKLLIDLPGNKVRTALAEPVAFSASKPFELGSHQFNYAGFVGELLPGDVLLANDSLFKFRVVAALGDRVRLVSEIAGVLRTDKGVHLVGRPLDLPFLFGRDRELIRHAVENGFDYLGLSFVRRPEDVDEATALAASFAGGARSSAKLPRMMVKIETGQAVERLDTILGRAEEFLVDRGDLSCDVGMENVDRVQKLILRRGKQLGKRVYFATQVLHSMQEYNTPLIAEACGLSDAIRSGVDGVQLSGETAVGKYPVNVLKTVQLMRSAARPAFRVASEPVPIVWLTGPRGSGKSTLAAKAAATLESRGFRCCVLDEAHFREIWHEPGSARDELGSFLFAAARAAKSFDLVIVAARFGARADRDLARRKLAGFHEIHLDRSPPPEDAAFEPPHRPELVLDTASADADETLRSLDLYLFGR